MQRIIIFLFLTSLSLTGCKFVSSNQEESPSQTFTNTLYQDNYIKRIVECPLRGYISAYDYCPSQNFIIYATDENRIFKVDLKNDSKTPVFLNFKNKIEKITEISISPSGKMVLFNTFIEKWYSNPKKTWIVEQLWLGNLKDQKIKRLPIKHYMFHDFQWGFDEMVVYFIGTGQYLYKMKLSTLKSTKIFPQRIQYFKLSPTKDKLLANPSGKKSLLIYDLKNKKIISYLPKNRYDNPIWDFNEDTKIYYLYYTRSLGSDIRILNLQTKEDRLLKEGYFAQLKSMAPKRLSFISYCPITGKDEGIFAMNLDKIYD